MATITTTDMRGTGAKTVTATTLSASDTFTYEPTGRMVLTLRNPTAGALSPVIDGDGATTIPVDGAAPYDISGGYAVGSIPAGGTVAVPLDTVRRYLSGTIAVTGGSGLIATLLRF